MKRQITRQSVNASLNGLVKSSDLSKERLESIVDFTANILEDNSIGSSNQLLKILKLFEHYNLI